MVTSRLPTRKAIRPSTRNLLSVAAVVLYASTAFCLTDIPLYTDLSSDVGCDGAIAHSSVQGTTLLTHTSGKVPITCSEHQSGTDAIRFQLNPGLGVGDWFNFTLKFPGMQQKDVSGHVDFRFFAKNSGSSGAKFSIRFENWLNNTASWSDRLQYTIPAHSPWTEYVISFASVPNFKGQGMNGVILSEPEPKSGAAGGFTVFFDDMRFTDGTGAGSLTIPSAYGGSLPQGWKNHFMVGTYDKYEDGSTMLSGKFDYRYQYLNYLEWKGYSGGTFIESFINRGNSLSMGSGFVWYYLGKAGESSVYENLNNAAFMKTYFDDYELALRKMAGAQSGPVIIVVEPDAFGFLMIGNRIPSMDATKMTCDMSWANQIAGTSYPNTLAGFCRYMVQRPKARLAKGAIVGHLLNHWGTYIPDGLGQGTLDAHLSAAAEQAAFLNSLGPEGKGDLFFVEKADRDAGTKGSSWFWDSTDYAKYFAWVKVISAKSGLRCCGWQISEGNMNHPVSANRDDAVACFVKNPSQWEKAGFIGILFGPGMDGQADYRNDGGWFLQQMSSYASSPLLFAGVQARPFIPGSRRDAKANARLYTLQGRVQREVTTPGVAVDSQGKRPRLRVLQPLR